MVAQIETIRRICADLGLPQGDSFTQDWAYELPEEFRSVSAFYRYVEAYNNPAYGEAERRILMQLALDIANDLIEADEAVGRSAWNTLADLLRARLELHRDQLEYWSAPGEDPEDAFALTPWARQLRNELCDSAGRQ